MGGGSRELKKLKKGQKEKLLNRKDGGRGHGTFSQAASSGALAPSSAVSVPQSTAMHHLLHELLKTADKPYTSRDIMSFIASFSISAWGGVAYIPTAHNEGKDWGPAFAYLFPAGSVATNFILALYFNDVVLKTVAGAYDPTLKKCGLAPTEISRMKKLLMSVMVPVSAVPNALIGMDDTYMHKLAMFIPMLVGISMLNTVAVHQAIQDLEAVFHAAGRRLRNKPVDHEYLENMAHANFIANLQKVADEIEQYMVREQMARVNDLQSATLRGGSLSVQGANYDEIIRNRLGDMPRVLELIESIWFYDSDAGVLQGKQPTMEEANLLLKELMTLAVDLSSAKPQFPMGSVAHYSRRALQVISAIGSAGGASMGYLDATAGAIGGLFGIEAAAARWSITGLISAPFSYLVGRIAFDVVGGVFDTTRHWFKTGEIKETLEQIHHRVMFPIVKYGLISFAALSFSSALRLLHEGMEEGGDLEALGKDEFVRKIFEACTIFFTAMFNGFCGPTVTRACARILSYLGFQKEAIDMLAVAHLKTKRATLAFADKVNQMGAKNTRAVAVQQLTHDALVEIYEARRDELLGLPTVVKEILDQYKALTSAQGFSNWLKSLTDDYELILESRDGSEVSLASLIETKKRELSNARADAAEHLWAELEGKVAQHLINSGVIAQGEQVNTEDQEAAEQLIRTQLTEEIAEQLKLQYGDRADERNTAVYAAIQEYCDHRVAAIVHMNEIVSESGSFAQPEYGKLATLIRSLCNLVLMQDGHEKHNISALIETLDGMMPVYSDGQPDTRGAYHIAHVGDYKGRGLFVTDLLVQHYFEHLVTPEVERLNHIIYPAIATAVQFDQDAVRKPGGRALGVIAQFENLPESVRNDVIVKLKTLFGIDAMLEPGWVLTGNVVKRAVDEFQTGTESNYGDRLFSTLFTSHSGRSDHGAAVDGVDITTPADVARARDEEVVGKPRAWYQKVGDTWNSVLDAVGELTIEPYVDDADVDVENGDGRYQQLHG